MKGVALILAFLNDFYIKVGEKCSFENKIQKNYCQPQKTPYNAPPLTGDVLKQATTAAEKSENNCLTLEAKSVRYAASQPGRKGRLPTLFNKLIRQSVWALARHYLSRKAKKD
ncbi:hypothetical protein [Xenorhabdus ishibashii]|uniref:Uncharacterized protein n=1 Tax=Xenorhabdus ishibashii TaxID=1034471 RepID=A0A2D0KFS0_9GAMM|nr:hypothetical protein [Xenorhabdus ishibashii]PHM62271.1 hypothetical protein Xish_01460 [Xenorhabdus ishibashii]